MIDDVRQWHAFYVKSRHEKKIGVLLENAGTNCFVPLVSKVHQWSDRRKIVEDPLIPGYIFCKINLEDRLDILKIPGVVKILKIAGKWAPIPENQIETLKIFTQNASTLKEESKIAVGETVTIVQGIYAGAQGVIVEQRGRSRLVLSVEKLNRVFSVEISKTDLKRNPSTS